MLRKRAQGLALKVLFSLAYSAGQARRVPHDLWALRSLPTARRLAWATFRFATFWTVVWVAQWTWAPDWLVESRAGLSTVFQTLPGVAVALFVLIVASLYVLGQQASAAYGHRAVAVLITDVHALSLLVRALVLAVVPLLVSGRVPDAGSPSSAITSLAATLLLATGVLFVQAANALGALLGTYIAPRSYVSRTTGFVPLDLVSGAVVEVVFKVSALTEMLRAGVRRGELNTVEAALYGLDRITSAYIEVAAIDPSVTTHHDTGNGSLEGWLGHYLAMGFSAAGDEALAHAASQEDTQLIARAFEDASRAFVDAGLVTGARAMIDGQIVLGTSPHQVRPETINLWPQSAGALAVMERVAEENDALDLAQDALAAWALVVAYPEFHFGWEHPSRAFSLDLMGSEPPWFAALRIVRSSEWQRVWTNKMPKGFAPVEAILVWAEGHHRAAT